MRIKRNNFRAAPQITVEDMDQSTINEGNAQYFQNFKLHKLPSPPQTQKHISSKLTKIKNIHHSGDSPFGHRRNTTLQDQMGLEQNVTD